jgi:membrane-associated phospholipid phosphatase
MSSESSIKDLTHNSKLKTHNFATQMRRVDSVLSAYLLFTLVVILARSDRVTHALRIFTINACLLILVQVLAAARARGGPAAVAAEWYPLAFFVVFFEQIGSLVHAFVLGWRDPLLIAADRAIFGVDLTVWIEQYASYWLTEVMQLAYTSYFVITAGVAAYLWVECGRDAFHRLMLASSITYCVCYVIFILFPIESPYHTMRHLQTVELHGGVFTAIIEWIERYGRVHGGAFPSAHVAGSVVTLLTARRVAPRLALWLTPLVGLLMIATVYGRYHYGVDVLAGVAVAVAGYAAAERWSARDSSLKLCHPSLAGSVSRDGPR